eukprot:1186640-Prorocentrum_minimum.AAC.4
MFVVPHVRTLTEPRKQSEKNIHHLLLRRCTGVRLLRRPRANGYTHLVAVHLGSKLKLIQLRLGEFLQLHLDLEDCEPPFTTSAQHIGLPDCQNPTPSFHPLSFPERADHARENAVNALARSLDRPVSLSFWVIKASRRNWSVRSSSRGGPLGARSMALTSSCGFFGFCFGGLPSGLLWVSAALVDWVNTPSVSELTQIAVGSEI